MKQDSAIDIMKFGDNVFLTGAAGTGKTYILNEYINYLKDRQVQPSIVAPTGIAATHLNGSTIHSFFGLGIRDSVDNYFLDSLLQKKYLNNRFEKIKVLIIDEVSMVSPEIFDAMDRILKAFKFSSESFGGVQIIASGDFFQLPPISKKKKKKRFSWQTDAWKYAEFKTCYLKVKYRQEDEKLIKVLDGIRSGEISEEVHDICKSCHNKDLGKDYRITKLYTHNIDVDKINIEELSKLEAEERIFLYAGKGTKINIEKIFKSCVAKEEIILKEGAVVLFIKNNYEKGYINGTSGVIVGFDEDDDYPIVEIFSGRKIKAEPDDWSFEDESGNIVASIKQIPLKLAWAITVHKSQGMTLDSAEIDLSKTFEVGQGYVALSRIKNIEGLNLLGINERALMVDSLILQIDERVKKSSEKSEKELNEISMKNKEVFFNAHIKRIDGVLEKKEIKAQSEKRIKKGLVDSIEISTYKKTENLINEFSDIRGIALKRGLSEETIINHLILLKKKDQNICLDKFKPGKKIIKIVQKTVDNLNKKKCLKSKDLKLSVIFKKLDGNISYNDIKVVLLL